MNTANIRKTILTIAHNSGASHIGSALSAVEIIDAVFSLCDVEKIKNRADDRDRVVLSKGHGTLALYSVMHSYNIMDDDFIEGYYRSGTVYAGCYSCAVKYAEHSTGALGHGLSVCAGIALGLKLKNSKAMVYCILGDGELHEGSNWEALMYAGNRKLSNLCILVDRNNLSGVSNINDCCSLNDLKAKFRAFNFNAVIVDGHNTNEIINAIKSNKKPLAVICNTVKGKGVSFIENDNVWHYRPLNNFDYEKSMEEM